MTARNGPGGIPSSEDVVCVAEIDKHMNIFENFLESNVLFRCCKVVDNQGELNVIPKCDLRVQKSNWYKAFYVVLNVLTFFGCLYSPAILCALPDYIFDLRKECEKEHQQEEKERLEQNSYLPLPSSQETREESSNVTDANAIASEWIGMRRPATLAEDNPNVIEESGTNESNVNDATENERNLTDPNLNGANSNDPNLSEPTSGASLNSSTNDKGKDEEEERKLDEIPVDDGSPVNILTLLYACASAKGFRDYPMKLSFNIKLAFLWFCVIPFLFYFELALSYTLKDEYLEEIRKKDVVILTGGLFVLFDMTQTGNYVVLIVSYLIIPLLIIMILRPKDLSIQVKSTGSTVYIGDIVLQHRKKSKELLLKILLLGKVPNHVYRAVQNPCDKCKKTGAPRLVRLAWVLLALISGIFAVICSVVMAVICVLFILLGSTAVLVSYSPYITIVLKFIAYNMFNRSPRLCILLSIFIIIPGFFMLLFSYAQPLLRIINPTTWFTFTVTAPFFLSFFSCRFVIKMWGYTIMGLIYNAEFAAPMTVLFATLASYLRDRYFDSKTKCKRVKEIISQEWQQRIKESLETGKLNEQEKPKVVSDAIPQKLFRYVCDGDEYQVFPPGREALRLLRDVAVIYFTAFLALCAIFFSSDSYQISTVASTIAVFVSAKIPMVLLRKTDNFNGWEKIKTKRIIRESVKKYIDDKEWLKPANEAMV